MDTYIIRIDRHYFLSDHLEVYKIGVIQGLVFGLCAIPCGTTLWDCERFNDFVLIPVECTDEHIENFMNTIEGMYPGLCTYTKRS